MRGWNSKVYKVWSDEGERYHSPEGFKWLTRLWHMNTWDEIEEEDEKIFDRLLNCMLIISLLPFGWNTSPIVYPDASIMKSVKLSLKVTYSTLNIDE